MNRYQKQLNTEVNQIAKNTLQNGMFRQLRKSVRFGIKLQTWSPCEDCDNCHCSNKQNKLFYCRDNR